MIEGKGLSVNAALLEPVVLKTSIWGEICCGLLCCFVLQQHGTLQAVNKAQVL